MPHTISRGYVILLILAAVALGACVSQPAPTDTATSIPPAPSSTAAPVLAKPPPPEDWPTRWLKGIPCRPPCWEGVTPGQTTAEEAVTILRQSSIVATVEVITQPLLPATGVMEWTWASIEWGEREGGWAAFHAKEPHSPIYAIYPSYLYTSFKLSDVIQAYGEPSHVMALFYQDYHDNNTIFYDLRVLYLSQGFTLEDDGGRMKPTLSADTRLERVTFFVPGEKGLLAALDGWAAYPDLFVPWQGMRDFDFYCRDERGNPCP